MSSEENRAKHCSQSNIFRPQVLLLRPRPVTAPNSHCTECKMQRGHWLLRRQWWDRVPTHNPLLLLVGYPSIRAHLKSELDRNDELKKFAWSTRDHGRRNEEGGALNPLDFEIWYFDINVSVEKCFCRSFKVGETKFHHFWSLWKQILLATLWENPLFPPEKYPSDVHARITNW